MQAKHTRAIPRFVKIAGSLWLATVLLVMLVFAMACATVFESTHGSEMALSVFYRAWWFEWLLGLVGVNMLAAVIARYPFTWRQLGFVLTHLSIIVVFVGTLTTKYFGIEGQVGLVEGETLDFIALPKAVATLANGATGASSTVDLQPAVGDGLSAIELREAESLTLENVSVAIDRYIPDSMYSERVEEVSEDATHVFPAVEVSLSASGRDNPVWLLFGLPTTVGSTTAMFRPLDADDVAQLLSSATAPQARSTGVVRVEHDRTTYDLPLDKCTEAAVPIGSTGMTLHVTHYLPHASITFDEHVVNLSANPVNPAIQIALAALDEVQTRILFAKAPDFRSVQGSQALSNVKVTFVLPVVLEAQAPIEVFGGPGGGLYVRFTWEGTIPTTQKLSINDPVDTPWPDKQFTVLRRYDRARRVRSLTEKVPIGTPRIPAVHATVTTSDGPEECWVRRRMPIDIENDGAMYELMFGDALLPLGFKIRLDRFEVGYYPGSRQPRSFESTISLIDAETGRTEQRSVSMNHPTSFGGYTFYQESYDVDSGQTMSFLSVAHDPGQPIVFAGYIGTMVGMVMVLIVRLQERRRPSSAETSYPESANRLSQRVQTGSSVDEEIRNCKVPNGGLT